MDVFKFFKEHERMCHSYPDYCAECPAQKYADKNYRTADGYCAIGNLINCYERRKNYWAQEVEDNE